MQQAVSELLVKIYEHTCYVFTGWHYTVQLAFTIEIISEDSMFWKKYVLQYWKFTI